MVIYFFNYLNLNFDLFCIDCTTELLFGCVQEVKLEKFTIL